MAFPNEINDAANSGAQDIEAAAPQVPDESKQPQVRFGGAHWLFLGVACSGIIGTVAVFLIWWGIAERSQGVVTAGLILFFVVNLVWGATAVVITYWALNILIPSVQVLLRNKRKIRLDG